MARETFFTTARREFIARSMMDAVKLIFVAAVVSGFFVSSPTLLRVISLTTLAIGFAISVITFPRKKEDG